MRPMFLVFTVARLSFLHYVSVGDVAPFIVPVSLFPTLARFCSKPLDVSACRPPKTPLRSLKQDLRGRCNCKKLWSH